jgi:hypothetical protein
LNDGTKHLVFHIMGRSHMVHSIDLLNIVNFIITCDDFEVARKVMKA